MGAEVSSNRKEALSMDKYRGGPIETVRQLILRYKDKDCGKCFHAYIVVVVKNLTILQFPRIRPGQTSTLRFLRRSSNGRRG